MLELVEVNAVHTDIFCQVLLSKAAFDPEFAYAGAEPNQLDRALGLRIRRR